MNRTIFLLFCFIPSLLMSHKAMALTSGPSQPEYHGFVSSSSMGIVDLLTGDFKYSTPIMEIPGPALNYPLTLGYCAGIKNEQEASWVGLGWSLNAGAINRDINRYPDDYYKGSSNTVFQSDSVVTGYDWEVSAGFGAGSISATWGERSDQGSHFGLDVSAFAFRVNLYSYNERDGSTSLGYYNQNSSFGIMMDFVQSLNAEAKGIANAYGNGAIAGYTGEYGNSNLSSMGMDLSFDGNGGSIGAHGFGASVSFGWSSTSSNIGSFHSESNSYSLSGGYGFHAGLSYRQYSYWLYQNNNDWLYGYLNLGNDFPQEDCQPDSWWEGSGNAPYTGHFSTQYTKMEYSYAPEMSSKVFTGRDNLFGALVALHAFGVSTPDLYVANAEGLSSSFRPYRQDVGDYFGMDRFEMDIPDWLAWVDQQGWVDWIPGARTEVDRWKNNRINALNEEVGRHATEFTPSDGSNYADNGKYTTVVFRELGASGGTFMGENWRQNWEENQPNPEPSVALHFRRRMRDDEFPGQSSYTEASYKSPYLPRWNSTSKKIVYENAPSQGTEYLDQRISASTGIFPKFRTDFASSENGKIPEKALIGFTFVRPDGMIYEYDKPVFSFFTFIGSHVKKQDYRPYNYNEIGFGDYKNTISMERSYATTWLLTAIKAPDYIDIGGNGVDKSDLGSWVLFKYDTHIPSYYFRSPYQGIMPTGTAKDNVGIVSTYYSSYGQATIGAKEIYYLTDIFTPTHHARFSLSDRKDGKEAPISNVTLEYFFKDPALSKYYIVARYCVPRIGDVINLRFTRRAVDEAQRTNYPDRLHDVDVTITDLKPLSPGSDYDARNGSTMKQKMYVNDDLDLGDEAYFIDPESGPITTEIVDQSIVYKRSPTTEPKLKRLDLIELFVLNSNGEDVGDPIRKVVFDYEADPAKQLCPGVINSYDDPANMREGKLTLRSLRIGSNNQYFPPYRFSYYMEGDQAPYNLNHWDRWGFYKHDGGLVNIRIERKNIVDWAGLLTFINQTDFPGKELTDTIGNLLNESDMTDLTSAGKTAATLSTRQKDALVESLNRIKNDPNLFHNNRNFFVAKDHWLDYRPYMFKTWNLIDENARRSKSYYWLYDYVGAMPHSPPGQRVGLIDMTDGHLTKNVSELKDYELNAIQGFNLALLAEYGFVTNETNDNRIICHFLEINRFDHNTNPDDVKAWSLKSVKTPSGSEMIINYESDDYSYINRTRVVDPVVKQIPGSDLSNLAYYQQFGFEKDLITSNNILRTGGWNDQTNTSVIEQQAGMPLKEVKMRATSLFRLYRNVGTADKPKWQLNKEFQYFIDHSDAKLYLFGLFDASIFSNWITNYGCDDCGKQDGRLGGHLGRAMTKIPINLGSITADNFTFLTIRPKVGPNGEDLGEELFDPATNSVRNDLACQEKSVDFDFSAFHDPKNWEHAIIYNNGQYGQCKIKYFLGGVLDFHCNDGKNELKYPADVQFDFQYPLVWGRRIDYTNNDEINQFVPDKMYAIDLDAGFGWPQEMTQFTNHSGHTVNIRDGVRAGNIDLCYTENGASERKGILSIRFLDALGLQNIDDFIPPGDDPSNYPFSVSYWDYHSINVSIKNDEPQIAGHVAGVPGGGVRVKRVAFNTGWPQKHGKPPVLRETEYAYVCEDDGGKIGNSSSGCTPSVPPPYSNKGDDRVDVTPQAAMISAAPNVTYRTVHEIRPGMGRIVYNYLTCADIADYWADDTANYYHIYDNQLLGVNGAYNIDQYDAQSMFNPHHRWRLNRCSQFQGLMFAQEKYDKSDQLVSQQKVRYLTSLTRDDICKIELIGKMNMVSSRISQAFIPEDENPLLAGSGTHEFTKHPLSDDMGKATERFRIRWAYTQPRKHWNGFELDQYNKSDYYKLIGLNEIEEIEHSIHEYEVQSTTNDVGAKTVNSYFDFITGKPIVTTVSAADHTVGSAGCVSCQSSDPVTVQVVADNSVPLKTSVIVPAHWLDSYNPDPSQISFLGISMGSVFRDNNFRNLALGTQGTSTNDLQYKNMVAQGYSNSIYSDLEPYPSNSADDGASWIQKLTDHRNPGENNALFKRNITTWKDFSLDSRGTKKVWRKEKEIQLRAPMTTTKHIDILNTDIGFPYDAPGTLSGYYIPIMENTQYDGYGHVLELKDANNHFASNFYDQGRSKGKYLIGTVMNSPVGECAILCFDELENISQLNGYGNIWVNNGGVIDNNFSRSGTQSLKMSQGDNLSLNLVLQEGKKYEYSFWVQSPSGTGTYSIFTLASESFDIPYQSNGPQWQRVTGSIVVPAGTMSMTFTIENATGNFNVDDIRFYPADAQATSMTYNKNGWMTSYAGPDDVISYYRYDAFGRLTEIKDHEGVIISTQAQHEAK